jgi:hypothetical protein
MDAPFRDMRNDVPAKFGAAAGGSIADPSGIRHAQAAASDQLYVRQVAIIIDLQERRRGSDRRPASKSPHGIAFVSGSQTDTLYIFHGLSSHNKHAIIMGRGQNRRKASRAGALFDQHLNWQGLFH